MLFRIWSKFTIIIASALIVLGCNSNTYEDEPNAFSDSSGERLYDLKCASCHGVEGTGVEAIDNTKVTYGNRTLKSYIEEEMQRGSTCVGDCAEKVAAYIRSWNPTSGNDSNSGGDSGSNGGNTNTGNTNTDPDTLSGNATTGKSQYEQQCTQCHNADGNGLYKLDATKSMFSHSSNSSVQLSLAQYINDYMAPSSRCTGQCAANVAAYIKTWTGSNGGTDSGNTGSNGGTDSGSTGSNGGTDSGNTGSNGGTDSGSTGSNGGTDSGSTGSNGGTDSSLSSSAKNGKTLYEGSLGCAGCHGSAGKAVLPSVPDIDPTKASLIVSSVSYNLEDYISAFMPMAGQCTGDCAADIAAYIRSWQPEQVSGSCEATGFEYGRRQMRLLTVREYESTIYDLMNYTVVAKANGVPTDTLVEGFSNQTLTAVTQGYMDAYMAIAEKAAVYAEGNDFADVVNCAGMSTGQCASEFISEFMPKAYRRPLTEDEKTRYRAFFAAQFSEGKNNEGLKMALRAALTSPYFLYRSEMGEKISDVRDRILNGEKTYEPGSVKLKLSGSDLQIADGAEYADIGLYNRIGINTSYTFTGHDVITVTAKGVEADGAYPSLKLEVDNANVTTQLVDSEDEMTYTFLVDGVSGSNKYVAFVNDINGASHSNGRTLSIRDVSFGNAVEVIVPTPHANLEDDAYMLTQYELASFLSYTYTGSMPDDALFTAAANNELMTEAQIEAQIVRLMGTDKARDHFAEFSAQWLGVDRVLSTTKNAEMFPNFTQSVRKLMAQEVREIFKHVMFDGEESISSLYGDFSYLNKDLAEFYGISGVTSNEFTQVNSLNNRGGVLTSGAFLAGYGNEEETSPIKRAVAVRERILCQEVPPMPTNIDLEREAANGALDDYIAEHGGAISNRLKYTFLTKGDACKSCHEEIINPLGFGIEDFDAIGLKRTADVNGTAIDASGQLIGLTTFGDGASLGFTGARDLSNSLVNLPQTQTCFAQKSFRYVMGTGHDVFDSIAANAPVLAADEKKAYQCGLDNMIEKMADHNQNARAAFTALGVSDFVRYRKQR